MSDIDNTPVVENTVAQPVAPPQGGEQPASTQATTTTADTAVPGENAEEQPQAEPKRDRKVEKRISRLTQQREAAIRDAGYWRGVAEAHASRSEPPADGVQPQQQTRQAPAVNHEHVETARAAIERVREAGEDIEDFDDVMEALTAPELKVTQPMVEFLLATETPAEMARWMTENPKEVARIARLQRDLAVPALEKVAARLASKPAPKITQAPPPGPTLRGRGAPQFDAEKASMDDYAKHWSDRRAKAGIRG